MTNILLGVGGTGAKTVESALMLLAAGGLKGAIHVGLIDQDGANGNVARTRLALTHLADFRSAWSNQNAANYVGWPNKYVSGLGSLDIRHLFESPEPNALWSPNQKHNSLHHIMGENLSSEHRHLFDLLFMNNEEEQTLPLAQGYRGRSHVGSAALVASLVDPRNALYPRLRELLDDPGHRQVNVFLVGSAFGGTGASGFPTIARKLARMRNDGSINNRGGIRIGGLLMLPYFSFDKPEEGASAVVTADELLPKAQLALEYYDNLFTHEQVFDRFYVLGWEHFFPLGYHEAGSPSKPIRPCPLNWLPPPPPLIFSRAQTRKTKNNNPALSMREKRRA
jgi:hypothetical protein